jgi:hypothetical protein
MALFPAAVTTVAFSPDGHFLAAGAQDQVRRLTLTTAPTTTASGR